MHVTFTVQLPATVKKEGRYFVSCCPILDVRSQATTQKKALSNLSEALSLFFISCFERGTLDQVLRESGFKPLHTARAKVDPLPKGFRTITVPIPFIASLRGHAEPCHA